MNICRRAVRLPISLPRMVQDGDIIFLQYLKSSALPQLQIPFNEDVLNTVMISEDLTMQPK